MTNDERDRRDRVWAAELLGDPTLRRLHPDLCAYARRELGPGAAELALEEARVAVARERAARAEANPRRVGELLAGALRVARGEVLA